MLSVRNGLLVVIMLISNHKSLAEQLVASDVTTVLKDCLTLSGAETMLAIIALNHISMVHKLESKGTAKLSIMGMYDVCCEADRCVFPVCGQTVGSNWTLRTQSCRCCW